ncbi:low temperature requirement protein A [Micromonospora inositola]|uniref:low temperature requirement protein A n=1 Tax=Micromonospora inositola TaxID=47865 RepID=UPI0015601C5A|nr:low temperature requirement protein A [Micromonospora inositola]
MTTSGTSGLLRKLEDVARASFLELFFDVVFVFALRALAQQLFNNLTWSGAFQALVLLVAIAWVWTQTARVTGQLNPRRPPVQALVLATMVGALVLSAAVPQAFGKTGLIFAVTYLAIQIGRDLFLMVLLRGQELQHVAGRAAIWHAATAVLWLAGAVASSTVRTALWTLAVALIHAAWWFSYPLPGLRRLAGAQMPPAGEYMADRYRALFVIALGEVVLAIGSSLTGRGFATDQTVAFVVAFAGTALIWRIYIFRAGQDMGPAIQASANPDRLGILVAYAHLVMIAGLVVASVTAELVIDDPFRPSARGHDRHHPRRYRAVPRRSDPPAIPGIRQHLEKPRHRAGRARMPPAADAAPATARQRHRYRHSPHRHRHRRQHSCTTTPPNDLPTRPPPPQQHVTSTGERHSPRQHHDRRECRASSGTNPSPIKRSTTGRLPAMPGFS